MYFLSKIYKNIYIIISCLLYLYIPLYALPQRDFHVLKVADSLYNSKSVDSTKQIIIPKEPSELQMQQEQIDLMRKEFHGNPAPSDLIYYKQDMIKRQIQRDSTLKINPDISEQTDIIGETEQYEFIIQYFFKIVDEIPYGEDYKLSIPLHTLGLKQNMPARTCTINLKEHSLLIKIYNHYTKAEMQASIRKQTQYLLYNLLKQYQAEVIECLMLNQTHLDDINTALNLQSRTKTITSLRSYVLVDFHGGILTLQVFNPPIKNNRKECYENSNC